jgi:hypothetical protein
VSTWQKDVFKSDEWFFRNDWPFVSIGIAGQVKTASGQLPYFIPADETILTFKPIHDEKNY